MSRVIGVYPGRGLLGGAVPAARPQPAPIGGSPGAIAGAYANNFRTADEINRSLAGSIESGYRQIAGDQTRMNDALQRGYQELATFLGGRAQIDQDAIRSGYSGLGDRLAGMARTTGADLGRGYSDLAGQMRGIGGWGGGELQNLYNRQADIDSRYAGLQRDVLGDIDSIGRSARMDIEERYRQDEARAQMDLSRRGLANSTVVDAVRRAARFDRERADIDLADRLAQTRANARSQLGLAGLGYRERAGELQTNQARFNQTTALGALERGEGARLAFGERNAADERNALERSNLAGLSAYDRSMADSRASQERLGMARLGFGERANQADTGLGLRQLDWMNSINAPYPDASLYTQLAALSDQAAANRNGPGGGLGGGGMGPTTRGGPWTGDRLQPGGGGPTLGSGFGSGFGPGGVRLNAGLGVTAPGGPYGIGGGYGSTGGGAAPATATPGLPYNPPTTGFGGGGGSGVDPDQLDLGGNPAGGLIPTGPLSRNPYFAPPPTGQVPVAAPSANPFAPAAGGFGGGFGGATYYPAEWELADYLAGA